LSSTSDYAHNTNQLLTNYSFITHSLALSLALASSGFSILLKTNALQDGGRGGIRTDLGSFFKIHYSVIITPPPEANSLITNERQ
jgi:hypothetical protein